MNLLCYNRSVIRQFFATLLYVYHSKKPNTTQKNRDLRLSLSVFKLGSRTTTTNYKHNTVVDRSKGQVMTSQMWPIAWTEIGLVTISKLTRNLSLPLKSVSSD